jgi:DNA-binding transcriptional LysR family regulator
LTHTAVSARIRTLEEQLGTPLFRRHKAGVVPTAAGERFHAFACSLVQAWERARRDVTPAAGTHAVALVGCEPGFWDCLFKDGLAWARRETPELAVHAEIAPADRLLDRIAGGGLDIAVVHAPGRREGVRAERLMQDELVLVSNRPDAAPPGDVFVDWGADFGERHGALSPAGAARPALACEPGPLAREYLLSVGGAGYLRRRAVARDLESGRLKLVPDAPEFPYPAYAVYSDAADAGVLEAVLRGLREVAAREGASAR